MLLLVLAFLLSGLVHAEIGNHSAASLSHEVVSAGDEAIGDEPCSGNVDEANGTACCIASFCAFCVPLISSSTTARAPVTELVTALSDEGQVGRAPSPGLRPPSLSTNV